ncbi:MarR family winged helix-turn-helix transcriptional regulator [Egicoccus sp. AB-alg6-2]|uniref:MarR family winged helix-turn-helix transcriptional regulator n=1 Tax=Egicoccus sp. AB-alg6-2 TaxID=3242692 RepID=UPI00359ED1DD
MEEPAAPLAFDPIAEAERNWRRHGWPAPAAMAAVTSLTRAHQILLRQVDAALRPFGLTFARYEALVLLHFSREGQLPLGKMGARLQVHPASVTNAIDRLQSAGYVERASHPTDGRTTLARITPQGRAVVVEATSALGEIRFGAVGLDDAAAERVTAELTAMRRAAGDF